MKQNSARIRKPASAFMYFSKANRDYIHKQGPGIKKEQIGKLLGEMWRELSDEEKVQYNNLAQQDQERYDREIAEEQI